MPTTINKTITIANGRAVKMKENWVVVNPQMMSLANHICVVSVRNAPTGMPTFLYLLEHCEVRQLKRDPDLNRIDAAITDIYPVYQEVLDQRVEPILKDGVCINVDEWQRSPEPGYFGLGAWPEYWEEASDED